MDSNNKWLIGTTILILLNVGGWTWALAQRASNAEHQAIINQVTSTQIQLTQETQDRKDADGVILNRLDGTPEKLAAIDAKLQIIMKKLGL